MLRSCLLPLACILVSLGPLAHTGIAGATSPLTVNSPSRTLETIASVQNAAEWDDGSDLESSTDQGVFLHTATATASIPDAQASAEGYQSSTIDSNGVHLVGTLELSASMGSTANSSGAMASNELSTSFYHAGGTEVPFSFRVTLSSSPGVTGTLSFAGAGNTYSVSFPDAGGSYEFSGLLLPGRTYYFVASADAIVEVDRFSGPSSVSESASFEAVFELEDATSAPGWGASATQLEVWPNPFRGQAQVSLVGPVPGGTLRVLDVRGRELRSVAMAPERRGWSWDGRDAQGRRAPAGVYLLSWDGAGERDVERVVLLR